MALRLPRPGGTSFCVLRLVCSWIASALFWRVRIYSGISPNFNAAERGAPKDRKWSYINVEVADLHLNVISSRRIRTSDFPAFCWLEKLLQP
jgi:hypothetical protein